MRVDAGGGTQGAGAEKQYSIQFKMIYQWASYQETKLK